MFFDLEVYATREDEVDRLLRGRVFVDLHRVVRQGLRASVINDRRYVVEATLVDPDRWRAYLVGVPGGPTALMPFDGETPEQAVERLADWLALAHRSSALTP